MNENPIIRTSGSPYVKLKSIPISSVKLLDGFWKTKLQLLQEVTLLEQYETLEEVGAINNFRRASGQIDIPFAGRPANDADVYKWIEAVSMSLASCEDENLLNKLKSILEKVVREVILAQREDGYLNTYFTFDRSNARWTNLRDMHELYCAGHLIQAAIANYRNTGSEELLDTSIRFADYIASIFGPDKRHGVPGHPNIEMALVELYRETGDKKYLDLSKFFIDERGKRIVGGDSNRIDHKPFRELEEMVGHAVRSLYLNCGATDVYMEIGDSTLFSALDRLWNNFVTKKMYVTGGAGARKEGEAFGENYELPNETAYAETCASIANLMWNYRMLLMSGESKFADIMELALYNGILSGISLDGREYFYVNPLADSGTHRRQMWFPTACCPGNIARTIASIPGYLYSTSSDGIWVHLYASNKAEFDINGSKVILEEKTTYPWNGKIEFSISGCSQFKLLLRKPEWAKEFSLFINKERIQPVLENGYLIIDRKWRNGDIVELILDMKPELLGSHPKIKDNIGRVAIRRGPIIYCIEFADNLWRYVWDLEISKDVQLEEEFKDILGGVMIIKGEGYIDEFINEWDKLYFPVKDLSLLKRRVKFTAIPYYAWANRIPGPMEVWIKSR